MNLLTLWFRQGRSSYGDVGPVSGEDRVDPHAPIQGHNFVSKRWPFRRSIPSPDGSVISMSYAFHSQRLKHLLKSRTEKSDLGDTILCLTLTTLGQMPRDRYSAVGLPAHYLCGIQQPAARIHQPSLRSAMVEQA